MSDGGYWVDSPDNPFNQMSYTRGGGGYDNSSTYESNLNRAHAMQGAGASALPHFATPAVAQKVLPAGSLAVVGGTTVVKTVAAKPAAAPAPAKPVTVGVGNPTGQVTTQGDGGATAGAGAGVVRTGSGGKGAGSRLVIGLPETTAIFVGGNEIPRDKGWSDGGDAEDRWGEIGGAIFGLGTMAADALHALNSYAAAEAGIYRDNHGLPDAIQGGGGFDMIMSGFGELQRLGASARLDSNGNVVRTGGGF